MVAFGALTQSLYVLTAIIIVIALAYASYKYFRFYYQLVRFGFLNY